MYFEVSYIHLLASGSLVDYAHLVFISFHPFCCLCLSSRDQGEVLAEALKMMLCDDRQHDMQKAAAFVKRLATFSLCFGSAEAMAGRLSFAFLVCYKKISYGFLVN